MAEIQILAVSHGTMAEGMVRAVRMVAGGLGNLDYLCLDEETSIEQFQARLSEKLRTYRDARQILVLADIRGGSPFTSSIGLLAELGLSEKSFVMAGMNLPLLLALAFRSEPVTGEELASLVKEAQESLFVYQEEPDDEEEL